MRKFFNIIKEFFKMMLIIIALLIGARFLYIIVVIGYGNILVTLDKPIVLSNYQEQLIYTKDFEYPMGIDLQFNINIPFKDRDIIFGTPVLFKDNVVKEEINSFANKPL